MLKSLPTKPRSNAPWTPFQRRTWLATRHRRVPPVDAGPPPTLLTDLVAYWDGDSDLDETANLSLLPEAYPAYGGSGGPSDGPSCALGADDFVYSEDEAFFNYTGMTFNAWVNQNEYSGV